MRTECRVICTYHLCSLMLTAVNILFINITKASFFIILHDYISVVSQVSFAEIVVSLYQSVKLLFGVVEVHLCLEASGHYGPLVINPGG